MKDDKGFVEKYTGTDVIVGRPIRLNQVRLESNSKGYAPLLFLGDIHYGHPQCRIDKVINMVNWALQEKSYVVLMGDMIECGLKTSVGDSVYKQKLNPQEQMEFVVALFKPLADAGLIIGIHEGNHENRITERTGIDITKIMAKLLGVRYLGYACWSLLRVGKQNYAMYSMHGSSGSRFKHTKLKAVMDVVAWIHADIVAMGHVHSIASESVIRQEVDLRSKTVKERISYVVLTGSYLSWDRSYAQMKNMPITKLGSPKAKLRADEHDVHFSL